jgi:TRAP-type C4-dicarboxylate transport system permease small subunit
MIQIKAKPNNSYLPRIRTIITLIAVLLIIGLFVDLLMGFPILKGAEGTLWWFAGLIMLAIVYLVGEGGAEWIQSKDNVAHPLHKRAFNLFLLLCFVAFIITALWAIYELYKS